MVRMGQLQLLRYSLLIAHSHRCNSPQLLRVNSQSKHHSMAGIGSLYHPGVTLLSRSLEVLSSSEFPVQVVAHLRISQSRWSADICRSIPGLISVWTVGQSGRRLTITSRLGVGKIGLPTGICQPTCLGQRQDSNRLECCCRKVDLNPSQLIWHHLLPVMLLMLLWLLEVQPSLPNPSDFLCILKLSHSQVVN